MKIPIEYLDMKLLPNSVRGISINASKNDTLHFLKISNKLTKQNVLDMKEFPKEHTNKIYFTKFSDCESYSEAIKSTNTKSRTVLPSNYIPRIAMGTVDPHEHPMLKQLFLGLTNNHVVVSANEAKIDFPAYSLLHWVEAIL